MELEKKLEKKNETSGVEMDIFQPFHPKELDPRVFGLHLTDKDLLQANHKKLKAPKGLVKAKMCGGKQINMDDYMKNVIS